MCSDRALLVMSWFLLNGINGDGNENGAVVERPGDHLCH